MKYFDSAENRLVYIRHKVSSNYWDNHWNVIEEKNIRRKILNSGKHSFYARIIKKYIDPKDGPILEGGCGIGSKVEALRLNKFACIGVDYAKKTIKILNKEIPELDIRYGDVRKLDFPDNYFTGYLSIGVIEHFRRGYSDIADEMFRVLKPGNFLFLAFPFMSFFRKIKAKLGFYRKFKDRNISNFYQYAFDKNEVIGFFEKKGFKFIQRKPYSVLYGIKDEIPQLKPLICFIERNNSKNIFTKAFYMGLDIITSFFLGDIFGHMVLLVLKKTKQ
ncbi:MAG: class I SAM-dependent methyltransferase [Candidatus Helarchaeota archaeon]